MRKSIPVVGIIIFIAACIGAIAVYCQKKNSSIKFGIYKDIIK